MITIFKFEYVKHPTIPLKDTFKSSEVEVAHCGDEFVSADGLNIVAINEVGKLIDGAVMFLTENDPHKFIEAVVRQILLATRALASHLSPLTSHPSLY